jgi:hypothetical protein
MNPTDPDYDRARTAIHGAVDAIFDLIVGVRLAEPTAEHARASQQGPTPATDPERPEVPCHRRASGGQAQPEGYTQRRRELRLFGEQRRKLQKELHSPQAAHVEEPTAIPKYDIAL